MMYFILALFGDCKRLLMKRFNNHLLMAKRFGLPTGHEMPFDYEPFYY